MAQKTTAEVLAGMIESKQNGRRRYDPSTFRTMQLSRERFAAAVAEWPITSITEKDIARYLGKFQVAPRTRHNVRTSIVTLFRFARRRRYLPEDRVAEAEKVEKGHWIKKPPAIFTPDELRMLLAHVRPELLPWLVLGAFASIRTAEICGSRKDWEQEQLHVRAEVGKTDEGRIVPMSDNLFTWMVQWQGRRGFICPRRAAYDRETLRLGWATRCGSTGSTTRARSCPAWRRRGSPSFHSTAGSS